MTCHHWVQIHHWRFACPKANKRGIQALNWATSFPVRLKLWGLILNNHGLALVSGWFSGRLLQHSVEEEIAAIEDHLALLEALGSTVMVYCEVTGCIHSDKTSPLSHRPTMTQQQWHEFGAKLTALAEYTQSRGVQIAYHHHMGTVIQSEQEIDLLMEHTGSAVGLLLDTGHLTYAGGDPVRVFNNHADRINHIHCKDVRSQVLDDVLNRNLSFLDAVLNGVFTVPGDGCVDYSSLFPYLQQSNYQGWLVVEAEQDPVIAHPLTYATMGAKNLKNFCQDAGLNIV